MKPETGLVAKNWQDPCALNLTKVVPLVRKVGYSSMLIAQGFH